MVEDKERNNSFGENDFNENKIKKKIQDKIVSIRKNNINELILDNINKSLYNYNIVNNRTKSGKDTQLKKNFYKNTKKVNNDKYS